MKIGFYGGTFDPFHLGHLNLAIQIKEKHQLDEVLVCPAAMSPFKERSNPASIEHRLNMVELGIKDVPGFRVLNWEALRPGPSFTIDTLRALKSTDLSQGKNNEYFLILGGDSITEFPNWKESQEVLEISPILVGKREIDQVLSKPELPVWLKDAIHRGETPIKIFEISGTEIRERLELNFFCGHLLPQKVLDYILRSHLYL